MEALRLRYQTQDLRSVCKLLGCYAAVLLIVNLGVEDGPMIGVLLCAVGAHFAWNAARFVSGWVR